MKRLLAVIMAAVMVCGCAAAEIDYAAMSADELKDVIAGAADELAARAEGLAEDVTGEAQEASETVSNAPDGVVKIAKGVVLFDENGIRVTADSEAKYYDKYGDDEWVLEFDVICENDSERNILISEDETYVNGWDCTALFSCSLDAGKKGRETVSVYDIDKVAGVKDVGEIECVEMKIYAFDGDTYDDVTEKRVVKFVP